MVLEVVLENFLCHTHYSVTLNKDINFIVGRNGSGKSAILTGLVVALGGNASTTGRGAALKGMCEFILRFFILRKRLTFILSLSCSFLRFCEAWMSLSPSNMCH